MISQLSVSTINLLIALLCAFINILFTLLIPCVLRKTTEPWLQKIKKIFTVHKQHIILSSIIIAIIVYIGLELTPSINLYYMRLFANTPNKPCYNTNIQEPEVIMYNLNRSELPSNITDLFEPISRTNLNLPCLQPLSSSSTATHFF